LSRTPFENLTVAKKSSCYVQILKYLKEKKLNPSKIICSSSARTRETITLIQKEHKFNSKIEFEDEIYLAEKEKLFLALLPYNKDTVGHFLGQGVQADRIF
jgi:phosphohistidine phosphatase SixA